MSCGLWDLLQEVQLPPWWEVMGQGRPARRVGQSEESAFSQKPSTSGEITKKELTEKLLFHGPIAGHW